MSIFWRFGAAVVLSSLSLVSTPALNFIVPSQPDAGAEIKEELDGAGYFYKVKYKVKNGDSIESISWQFSVRPDHLREANGFGAKEVVHPGQTIFIPRINWSAYEGYASWYGPGFHGKEMASGLVYNQNQILIAHREFPLGMKVKITNLLNGKSIVAPVLDRGPYVKKNGRYIRDVDLSRAAAEALEAIGPGVIPVRIEPIQ